MNKRLTKSQIKITMEENINNENLEIVNHEPEQACGCKSDKKPCNCHLPLIIVLALLCIATIVLYVLHFTGGQKAVKTSGGEAVTAVSADGQSLRVAYINTDTLMAGYDYARELQRKIEQVSNQQESLLQQEQQFQADYQNFLQTGENMTLTQQQEKEKELKARYEKLSRLEKQYAELLPQKQKSLQDELDKMTKAVYNFIADYNAKHEKYNLILAKSYSNTPVLYGDEGMDITQEILDGLNAEYAQVKKNK